MKVFNKVTVMVIAFLFIASLGFAGGKPRSAKSKVEIQKITIEQQYTQQMKALATKRQQYLSAVQQIEIEMIKIQAVLEYIKNKEAEENK